MTIVEQYSSMSRHRLGVLVGEPAGSELELDLNKGHFYRIKNHRSLCIITCQNGAIWITQENDQQDYVLAKGELHIIAQKGLVLIEALRDSSIKIKKCITQTSAA